MIAHPENLLLAPAVVALAAGAFVPRVRVFRGCPALLVPALALVVTLLGAAVVLRWLREGQGPFLTLYDVLLSNLCTLAAIYLVAVLIAPVFRSIAGVVQSFLAVLGLWALSVPPEAEPLPASFDNPWLWVHVASGKLFFGICMLAAGAALVALRSARVDSAIPYRADRLDAAIWPALSAAFVCHSFMLVAGAVWAYSAWGRYWAWDSLETWTFATWLAMAVLLHVRVTYRRLPATAGQLAVLGLFVLAVLTFLGVPFISVAPHKGVM